MSSHPILILSVNFIFTDSNSSTMRCINWHLLTYLLTYKELWPHLHSQALIFPVWYIFDEKCTCAVQMGWRTCLSVEHLHGCYYRSCIDISDIRCLMKNILSFSSDGVWRPIVLNCYSSWQQLTIYIWSSCTGKSCVDTETSPAPCSAGKAVMVNSGSFF